MRFLCLEIYRSTHFNVLTVRLLIEWDANVGILYIFSRNESALKKMCVNKVKIGHIHWVYFADLDITPK